MLGDLGRILWWWFNIWVIGIVFLPLSKRVFKNFFDNGYLFSKVVGIALASWSVWFFASFKILPFTREVIWLILGFWFLVNWVGLQKFAGLSNEPKNRFKIFLFEEILFLVTFIFWGWVRGFQPDIQGLEKFMDFGFVNSILRSKYFPPADMWFAGKSINYYYFGHYVTAFLTKLTGLDSATTYNLMMALLFGFCFSLTFSLAANFVYVWKRNILKKNRKFSLKPAVIAGLISALVVSLGANLHPAYYNFKMKVLKKPYCNGAFSYWYPSATRYIGYCPDVDDKTIHEFPSYSFVVSDLHGHVSDIPFVLTFLATGFVLFQKIKEKNLQAKKKNQSLLKVKIPKLLKDFFKTKNMEWNWEFTGLIILASFLLGITFMTNQWDYPIYLLVFGALVLVASFLEKKSTPWEKLIVKTGAVCLIVVILSILWVIPFLINFEQIAKGVDFVHAHSRWYQLLILWGGFWFFGISFLLFLFFSKVKIKTWFKKENLVKKISNFLGVEVQLTAEKNQQKNYSPFLIVDSDWVVVVMIIISTLLIVIPEIVYVKDIYISSHHRANTMFKLTYQSFIMFSLVLGYILVRVNLSLKKVWLRKLLLLCYLVLFFCFMTYPFYAIKGYYGTLKKQNYKGLYGLSFLKKLYPDDYETVLWFKKSVAGQPNILEAVGDSYTDYERISMATGLPTIQGWFVHEWLWRGSPNEPEKRASEVQLIYETKDEKQAKEILDRYNVRYVIVGEMERQKYPLLNESKFEKIGEKVFQSGKTVVYKIN